MKNNTSLPELYSGFFVLPVRYTVPAELERELGIGTHVLARAAFDEVVCIGNWFNVYYHRFEVELNETNTEAFELSCHFNQTDRVVEIAIEPAGKSITVDLPEGWAGGVLDPGPAD
jgi:hypothetical protein